MSCKRRSSWIGLVVVLIALLAAPGASAACHVNDRASHQERTVARATYEASWAREDWRFGVDGSESPHLRLARRENPRWTAYVWPGSPATPLSPPKVILGTAVIELMACRARWAYSVLLHEWAHVYQSEETLRGPLVESGAENFARAALGARHWSPWLVRGQFGCAWGVPPRELEWHRRAPITAANIQPPICRQDQT